MGPNPPPNPGSAEAVAAGCLCPVIDNARGEGMPAPGPFGGRWWYLSERCPLHGTKDVPVGEVST